MRISDWSSDVCSSDLRPAGPAGEGCPARPGARPRAGADSCGDPVQSAAGDGVVALVQPRVVGLFETHGEHQSIAQLRSEERRVGKEGVSTGRYRGAPYRSNTKIEQSIEELCK